MYNGKLETITLKFSKKLIGVIYDKFGEDTAVWRDENGEYTATVKVQISPTFWGWLFQFGGKMRVMSPAPICEEMKYQLSILVKSISKDIES